MRKTLAILFLIFCLVIAISSCSDDSSTDLSETVNAVYEYIPFPQAYVLEKAQTPLSSNVSCNFLNAAVKEFNIKTSDYPRIDFESGVIPENAIRITSEAMIKLYEKMYGSGSFKTVFPRDILSNEVQYLFKYDSKSDTYVFIDDGGAGAEYEGGYYRNFIKYEVENDLLYIYDVFASIYDVYHTVDNELKKINIVGGACKFNNDNLHYVIFESENITEFNEFVDNLRIGAFDETLPMYKHTFAKAEDGNYYWVQSESLDSVEPSSIENLGN